MDTHVDYLLLGGGLAAATAAATLRSEGATDTITMIASEDVLPYHRPPLSKGYLLRNQEVENFLVQPPGFYQDSAIDVRLGTRAVHVDARRSLVETDHAGSFHYRKLLIATGTRIRRLAVPDADLSGVYYLRTLADASALRYLHGVRKESGHYRIEFYRDGTGRGFCLSRSAHNGDVSVQSPRSCSMART